MLEWAAKLRDLSGGKPVGIKLCVGQPHAVYAVMKAMIETGIRLDYIVVDGAEGGPGAAPVEFSNRVGMPLREGLLFVRNALVGCGLKEEIRLASSDAPPTHLQPLMRTPSPASALTPNTTQPTPHT